MVSRRSAFTKCVDLIPQMGMEDLRCLNNHVVDQIKHLRRQVATKASLEWGLGDTVYFNDRLKRVSSGTVVKVNPTRLKVSCSGGMTWKVPYSMAYKTKAEANGA